MKINKEREKSLSSADKAERSMGIVDDNDKTIGDLHKSELIKRK